MTVVLKGLIISSAVQSALFFGLSHQIIWRRASDPNPLTIGDLVYVADDRYSIQSVPERQEWNLRIKNVVKQDAGVYECQISSRYKLIHHIMLRVNMTERPQRERYVNFKKDITMNGTRFVEKGDSIHLVCNASGQNYPPEDLDWFKDGVKVTADGLRHITIDKFRLLPSKMLVSVLDKKYSEMSDAGTYVCRSSNMGITSLKVHVLNAGSTNVRRGIRSRDPAVDVSQLDHRHDWPGSVTWFIFIGQGQSHGCVFGEGYPM
ncbi:hypothetical protein BaRGS_00002481, partial [Batillaria attramentaria]